MHERVRDKEYMKRLRQPPSNTVTSRCFAVAVALHLVERRRDRRRAGIVTEHDVLEALAATLPSITGADPDTYL